MSVGKETDTRGPLNRGRVDSETRKSPKSQRSPFFSTSRVGWGGGRTQKLGKLRKPRDLRFFAHAEGGGNSEHSYQCQLVAKPDTRVNPNQPSRLPHTHVLFDVHLYLFVSMYGPVACSISAQSRHPVCRCRFAMTLAKNGCRLSHAMIAFDTRGTPETRTDRKTHCSRTQVM